MIMKLGPGVTVPLKYHKRKSNC